MTPERPLAGLRVIEVADGRAAAFCGRQFAVWGADVVLFEPDGGSRLRDLGPHWHAPDAAGGSVPFAFLAAGKRSLCAARGLSDDVLRRADVLVLDDVAAERSALDSEELARRYPRLVIVHLSAFGLDSEDLGQDIDIAELQARTGYLALNGPPDGAPILAPDGLLEHAVGVNAFVGAMAGMVRRQRTGCGGLVEISGLETVAGLLLYLREQQLGVSSPRQGGTPEGARLIRCLDGYVSVAPAIPAHLGAYRDALGMSATEAPDSLLEGGRGLAADRAAAAFAPFAARLPVDAIFLGLQTAGVVCGIVQSAEAVLVDRQLAALEFFRAATFGRVGDVKMAGRAARLDGVNGAILGRLVQGT
jgi:crotonobetainyl-CoA:carnitine CoA-transferase CaiB-like acyl-CoA transferase